MENELVVIEKVNAMAVFTAEKGLEPFLQKIRKEIDAFVPDMTTPKGRKAIITMAGKVSKSKTYLEGVGKELVKELKEKPKLIDAERRRMRDILDGWKEEVRKPVTEWEDKEKQRVADLETKVRDLRSIKDLYHEDLNLDSITRLIDKADAVIVDDTWGEFKATALSVKDDVCLFLGAKLQARKEFDLRQAELVQLRAEKQERDRKDAEDKRINEAQVKVKFEAEQKALEEKRLSEEREAKLKADAEKAERDKKEALEKVETDKLLAIKKAEGEKLVAIENERKRVAAEKEKEILKNKFREEEAEKLKRDTDHRKSIHNAILTALLDNGFDEDSSKTIITLAAQGKLATLTVGY